MHSNEETSQRSNRCLQEVDSSEELNETRPTSLGILFISLRNDKTRSAVYYPKYFFRKFFEPNRNVIKNSG